MWTLFVSWAHGLKDHRKKTIFLKIRLLAQWALSRILAKIEDRSNDQVTWSHALV